MKRYFSVLLILLFIMSNVMTAHPEDAMHAVRHTESIVQSRALDTVTLAPTLKMGPVYSLVQGSDGALYVKEPSEDYKEELYTEIILAVLAQSVHNGAASEDLDSFMQTSLEGNDFLRCRIGHIRKVGDDYMALYFRKGPTDPRLFTVTFSSLKKGEEINKENAAVIELPGGALIKVSLLAVENTYRTAKKIFSIKEIEGYKMMLEVTQSIAIGANITGSVERFFTDAGFQDAKMEVLESISNRLLEGYREGKVEKKNIETFFKAIKSRIVEFSNNTEVSQAVQLMTGQALTIMSWHDRGLTSAGALKVSSQADDMVRNDKRGLSMIASESLKEDIPEVKTEGESGFYWRGTEKLKKLGSNVSKNLIYSQDRFDSSKDNMVMYLMDHGFIPVPDEVVDATNSGKISTIHETYFLNDTLPGSVQTTSTGPGHFQGLKVDVKQVTEGAGVQVNLRYNSKGEIEEVVMQLITEGDWALALPGSVDYMINLGGLRFNDMSIALDPEDAASLNPNFDFSEENLSKVEASIAEKGGVAPYLAAAGMRVPTFVPNMDNMPEETWMDPLFGFATDVSITDIYAGLNEDKLKSLVQTLKEAQAVTRKKLRSMDISVMQADAFNDIKGFDGPTLGKTEAVDMYWDINKKLIIDMLGPQASEDMLIRVPVEAVEAIGAASLKDFLRAIQDTPHGYVELYSSEGILEVTQDVYEQYGLEKKEFSPKRTRQNTITLMTVLKGEDFTSMGTNDGKWHIGDIKPTDTIVSPVGVNYDRVGFIRGTLFGMRLSAIAQQVKKNGQADEDFVMATISQYRSYCAAMGVRDFDFDMEDLYNMVSGNINEIAKSLKKLIDSLPISPVNAEELRRAYEHAREALIAA